MTIGIISSRDILLVGITIGICIEIATDYAATVTELWPVPPLSTSTLLRLRRDIWENADIVEYSLVPMGCRMSQYRGERKSSEVTGIGFGRLSGIRAGIWDGLVIGWLSDVPEPLGWLVIRWPVIVAGITRCCIPPRRAKSPPDEPAPPLNGNNNRAGVPDGPAIGRPLGWLDRPVVVAGLTHCGKPLPRRPELQPDESPLGLSGANEAKLDEPTSGEIDWRWPNGIYADCYALTNDRTPSRAWWCLEFGGHFHSDHHRMDIHHQLPDDRSAAAGCLLLCQPLHVVSCLYNRMMLIFCGHENHTKYYLLPLIRGDRGSPVLSAGN